MTTSNRQAVSENRGGAPRAAPGNQKYAHGPTSACGVDLLLCEGAVSITHRFLNEMHWFTECVAEKNTLTEYSRRRLDRKINGVVRISITSYLNGIFETELACCLLKDFAT